MRSGILTIWNLAAYLRQTSASELGPWAGKNVSKITLDYEIDNIY
jgi:hypothetical protein